jgi:hypothetical protein
MRLSLPELVILQTLKALQIDGRPAVPNYIERAKQLRAYLEAPKPESTARVPTLSEFVRGEYSVLQSSDGTLSIESLPRGETRFRVQGSVIRQFLYAEFTKLPQECATQLGRDEEDVRPFVDAQIELLGRRRDPASSEALIEPQPAKIIHEPGRGYARFDGRHVYTRFEVDGEREQRGWTTGLYVFEADAHSDTKQVDAAFDSGATRVARWLDIVWEQTALFKPVLGLNITGAGVAAIEGLPQVVTPSGVVPPFACAPWSKRDTASAPGPDSTGGTAPTDGVPPSTQKGGRPRLSAQEEKKRIGLLDRWERAKGAGVHQKDFCRDENVNPKHLTKCINWASQRRRRSNGS